MVKYQDLIMLSLSLILLFIIDAQGMQSGQGRGTSPPKDDPSKPGQTGPQSSGPSAVEARPTAAGVAQLTDELQFQPLQAFGHAIVHDHFHVPGQHEDATGSSSSSAVSSLTGEPVENVPTAGFEEVSPHVLRKRLWLKQIMAPDEEALRNGVKYDYKQLHLFWEDENCQDFTRPLDYQWFSADSNHISILVKANAMALEFDGDEKDKKGKKVLQSHSLAHKPHAPVETPYLLFTKKEQILFNYLHEFHVPVLKRIPLMQINTDMENKSKWGVRFTYEEVHAEIYKENGKCRARSVDGKHHFALYACPLIDVNSQIYNGCKTKRLFISHHVNGEQQQFYELDTSVPNDKDHHRIYAIATGRFSWVWSKKYNEQHMTEANINKRLGKLLQKKQYHGEFINDQVLEKKGKQDLENIFRCVYETEFEHWIRPFDVDDWFETDEAGPSQPSA